MSTSLSFPVTKVAESRYSENHTLEFGAIVSDHIFLSEYSDGAWHNPRIQPYGNLSLSPTIAALHYGQAVFEGMKAFRMSDGNVSIFRIEKHLARFNRSLARMCMPEVSLELFRDALVQLIGLDSIWVPSSAGSSLYIRPFMFATDERFGVKISDNYIFSIFSGPVGPYYAKPLSVKVEDTYRRSAPGGTGAAKCAGNYGGAYYPTKLAREQGFDQVLWTDCSEDLHIEESGTMNVIFVIDGKIVTPPTSDTLLDGVTRDSVLTIARSLGIPVEERPISAKDLVEASEKGILQEAFGLGTAAVSAQIKFITIRGTKIEIPDVTEKSLVRRCVAKLLAIRHGEAPDEFGWNTVISTK